MKLLLLLLWLLALPALAQEVPVLRGQVLDADTYQPIPNAQVGIAGNKLGTSTNAEGRFALGVPAAYARTELAVALLGYRRYTQALPPLPGPELRIALKISPAGLGTVAITSSAEGIIRAALARIPLNYPVRPTQLTGFYRESDDDAASRRYDYLVEGLLRVGKPGYQHPRAPGYVQVLESRKVDLRRPEAGQPLPLAIDWHSGSFVPQRFDFVQQRADFINPAHFKEYHYRFSSQTTFQGREVYVITFGPRPGTDRANFAGEVYIEEHSYAFLGASWHRTPAGIAREHVLSFTATERAYRTEYQLYAGRYYLKSIWYNTLAEPRAGRLHHHLAEFVTTAIDTTQADPPGYLARSQYADVFLQNPVPYDSAFWQQHTTLLPPAQLAAGLLDSARGRQAAVLFAPTPTPTPPAHKWNLLRHLRYTYTGGLLPVRLPTAALHAVLAPAGSTFRAEAQASTTSQSLTWQYGIGVQLDLVGGLSAYATSRHVLRQLRGEGWEAGLLYAHNFNPRGRPLRGRASLGYLRQSVGRELGTFANPDASLHLAGSALPGDKLTLSLQNITDALLPKLGVGVELNRHWEATAELGYVLPLRTRTQLLVEEKAGFFNFNQHTADLALPATEVQLTVNGQPAPAGPWQLGHLLLSVGLACRLGQ
ncbi:MAG: carboxypeptidase-like regulatory domain-containing protein [Janthinobacterium lividum]